jgi:hypothetical protein
MCPTNVDFDPAFRRKPDQAATRGVSISALSISALEATPRSGQYNRMLTLRSIAVLFAAFALAPIAKASPSVVTLTGEDGRSRTLSVKDLDALPQGAATITHEGKAYGFKGALLGEVVKLVDAPLGSAMRGQALSDVVIVTAADGYVVTLALSDLEPTIRSTKTILADATAEGSPLDKDGPFRLVVDGDLKPARSERNVVAIEVRRLRSPH